MPECINCDSEAETECYVTGQPLCADHARRGVDVLRSIGRRRCGDCGYEWFYGGDADRPTCPDCKGKRTRSVADATPSDG